jgi:hypothetical protein
MKPFTAIPVLPDSRKPSRSRNGPKPKGRICKSKGCKTVLSIYNKYDICAGCDLKVPLGDLPTNMGKYL